MLAAGFGPFDRDLEWLSHCYGRLPRRFVRGLAEAFSVYIALIAAAGIEFTRAGHFWKGPRLADHRRAVES
jgi:hypothetical protein